MALPSTAVWEIRASATAGNVNGGGFNAARGGTDYTLQNASQVNGTDGTSNASTNFNSATAVFTALMPGNYLHLVSGTNGTPGWYEIVTFVDANNVTLDRNCSTGAMTNGVFHVGGAMSMNSTLDDEMFEAGVAGNKYWIRQAAGAVTLGEAVTISAVGGVSNPIKIEGYTSTRGDAPTGTSRPTINQGSLAIILGNNWEIYNTIHTGTASQVLASGTGGKIVNCKATNSSTTAARVAILATNDSMVFNCEAISYRGIGIDSSGGGLILGNYVHDCDVGIRNATNVVTVVASNIVSSCVTRALHFNAAVGVYAHIANNTLYGSANTTGVGITFDTGCTDMRVTNNIITGFVTGVTHADTTQTIGFDDYNCYNNNDTDVTGWIKGAHDVTTAPAFTNVTQITGTTGAFTAGNDRIVDTSKDFTALGVVANQDHIYIISGTGVTAGIYAVTAIATTTNPNDTLVLTPAPGTSTVADKVYQMTVGHNFKVTGAL